MNTELFLAKRFMKSQRGNRKYTMPIIRLSVVAIALSLTVLIISVSIVTGFKKEVRSKVIGFGGHIQIINYDSNNSFESSPIKIEKSLTDTIRAIDGINNIQVFATKPAIIKTKSTNQGVILKGIGNDFDTAFFSKNLIEGRMPIISLTEKSNEVLISGKIASLLELNLKDKFIAFFIDERIPNRPVNRRVFTICGVFETSLEQFDEQFIFGDIKHIQTLNGWDENIVGGYEILINDYKYLDYYTELVHSKVGYSFQEDGGRLGVVNIKSKHPQIFDWLGLINMNVYVILIIMGFVAVINMVSGLIILILDRTPSIGLLKALGTNNKSMRKIFLYQSFHLILKGLLYGNIVSLTLIFLQDKFHIIKLDKASYFVEYAPVNINLLHILLINIGTLIVIFMFMLLPVIIVTRIQPVKTLRYN